MGRVDDAMRRAAEERAKEPGADVVSKDQAVTLADEEFPLELRPRTSRPAPAAPAVDSERTQRTSSAPTSLPSRLIESLDRRLTAKLVADQAMAPGSREQYRRLAAGLHHMQAATGLKVVMIASAVAAEGKTLTAANLALTFSESYRRSVLLIDGDLRRPSVHTIFKVEATPGLSDGLMAVDHRKLPVHQISERLAILPAGRPSTDPMAGLTSERMRQLIEEARAAFDWVIIDTPPVGLMTDANLLAAMADGTVLVVKANSTAYQSVQRAIDAIGRERFLGAVLNRATLGAHNGYKHYDYYYGSADATAAQE